MKHRPATAIILATAMLLSACGVAPQIVDVPSPVKGAVSDPVHGLEVKLAIGAMEGAGETVANGVATVHHMQDGTAIVGVQLNIASAKDGTHYEGWLSSGLGGTRINLGELTAAGSDVRHSVRAELPKLDSGSDTVLITLEGSGISEGSQVVATGKMKEIRR